VSLFDSEECRKMRNNTNYIHALMMNTYFSKIHLMIMSAQLDWRGNLEGLVSHFGVQKMRKAFADRDVIGGRVTQFFSCTTYIISMG
jgi:hypothetical protein